MEVTIYNVEHGFCSSIISDNGNLILIDCGHNSTTGFRPSTHLPKIRQHSIENLIISNYDQDHISDLSHIINTLPIKTLNRNTSITSDQLYQIKKQSGPITLEMSILFELMNQYKFPNPIQIDFGDISIKYFYLKYPNVSDTNNLSLLTFIYYHGLCFLFPGDIEEMGWKLLLSDNSFRDWLNRTNIFIASHHGRKSGYYSDIFSHFTPELILISDEMVQYDTQKVDYSRHVKGIKSNYDNNKRYVLTTRKDGMIVITKNQNNPYEIYIENSE